MQGQMNIDGVEEVPEKRVFTVTVDFTVDLDEVYQSLLDEFDAVKPVNELEEDELEEARKTARENLDQVWNGSDLDIINLIMEDLHDAIEDSDITMVPVGFRRTA